MTTVTVSSYGDLISDDALTVASADAVAQALNDGVEFVAHVPEWLFGAKGFDPGPEGILTGPLVYESEKAYLVEIEGKDVWLPKSAIRVYEAAPDAQLYTPTQEQE